MKGTFCSFMTSVQHLVYRKKEVEKCKATFRKITSFGESDREFLPRYWWLRASGYWEELVEVFKHLTDKEKVSLRNSVEMQDARYMLNRFERNHFDMVNGMFIPQDRDTDELLHAINQFIFIL